MSFSLATAEPAAPTTDVAFAELTQGDRVVAIDGHRLQAPVTVERNVRRADGAVYLINPRPASDVEWALYPAVGDVFTVERAADALDRPTALAYDIDDARTDGAHAAAEALVPQFAEAAAAVEQAPRRVRTVPPVELDRRPRPSPRYGRYGRSVPGQGVGTRNLSRDQQEALRQAYAAGGRLRDLHGSMETALQGRGLIGPSRETYVRGGVTRRWQYLTAAGLTWARADAARRLPGASPQ